MMIAVVTISGQLARLWRRKGYISAVAGSARDAAFAMASHFPEVFMVPPEMVEGQAEEGGSQADQQRNKQDGQDDQQARRGPITCW